MSDNRFANAFGIEELIGQLVGAGSMCWENVSGAGEFASVTASEIMREAIERLSQLLGEGIPARQAQIVGGLGDGATVLREYVVRITDGGIDVYAPGISDIVPQQRFLEMVTLDAAATAASFARQAGLDGGAEALAEIAVEIGRAIS